MHDSYLPNSFDDDSKRESYLVELFRSFREIYDDRLRVVYLCERDTSDPFLADIVSANVLDIFNTRSFKLIDFVEQINQPPKFSNVKKFTEVVTRETASAVADESKTEEEAGIQEKQQEEQKPKEIIKEVIKEKVVVRDRIVQTSSMLVGVVNLTVKAGSSFLTTLMAKSLAEHDVSVSVFDVPINQPGKSYIFDLLGFHLHFKEDYYPLHQEYKEKEDITKHTDPKKLYEHINWHVFNPHY